MEYSAYLNQLMHFTIALDRYYRLISERMLEISDPEVGTLLDVAPRLVCRALFKKSDASLPIIAFLRQSSKTLIRSI